MSTSSLNDPCPCGGGAYADCCQPYHQGQPAPTALALMRSRYSAYALKLQAYLLATWHPTTRPDGLDLQEDSSRWIGLQILAQRESTPATATVEFVARYKIHGRAYRLHEISRFAREREYWYYVDGDFPGKAPV